MSDKQTPLKSLKSHAAVQPYETKEQFDARNSQWGAGAWDNMPYKPAPQDMTLHGDQVSNSDFQKNAQAQFDKNFHAPPPEIESPMEKEERLALEFQKAQLKKKLGY